MEKNDHPEPPEGAASLLHSVLSAERIRIIPRANKKEVIDLLISLLADSQGLVSSQQALSDAIWAREKLMSTGIGLSLAIPHARLAAVSRIAAAAVLVTEGVPDYESLDAQPVRLVVMIVAREGDHSQHLRLLAQLSNRLKNESVLKAILSASSQERLFHLLAD